MTRIVTCICLHDFQDQQYGKNKRVANLLKDKEKARCTVCGQVYTK